MAWNTTYTPSTGLGSFMKRNVAAWCDKVLAEKAPKAPKATPAETPKVGELVAS